MELRNLEATRLGFLPAAFHGCYSLLSRSVERLRPKGSTRRPAPVMDATRKEDLWAMFKVA